MRFLLDAQLPPRLAKLLRARGHEADHAVDLGLGAADDSAIWSRAGALGAVIITKDDDFRERVLFSKGRVQVVVIRIGNCSNQALV